MRSTKTIALFFLLASCTPAPAYAATLPDRHRAAVVDAANVIPDAEEKTLNDKLVAWDRKTGHQIVVATIPSLGGMDIAEFGVQLGRTWGLGRDGVNDGAILILAPNERKVRIEVGYGLEPALTDAITGQIVRTTIVPLLKAGDIGNALTAGANDMMTTINAYDTPEQVKADNAKAQNPATGSWWWLISLLALPAAAVPIVMARRRRKKAEAQARRPVITKTASFCRQESFIAEPRKRYQPTTARAPTPPTRGTSQAYDESSRTAAAASVATSSYAYASSYSPPSPSYDSSSSGGFDSGGGSFGGGGSDSSY